MFPKLKDQRPTFLLVMKYTRHNDTLQNITGEWRVATKYNAIEFK